MCVVDSKAALRQIAQNKRRIAANEAGPKAAIRLANNLGAQFTSFTGQVVAGYISIASEIDVVPALKLLQNVGLTAALPVIVGRDQPLVFCHWTEEMALEPGPFQTRQPPATSPHIIPDILFVPMLAFDLEGYRIGWGGGFYDRTLIKLRALKPIIAVGVAFSGQQVDKIPHDQHDARLDWIATELGMTKIAKS